MTPALASSFSSSSARAVTTGVIAVAATVAVHQFYNYLHRTSTKTSPFQAWLQKKKRANWGKKTTLKQEFELAIELYERAFPNAKATQSVTDVIKMVENTPIKDTKSIVSWTGIKVEWFLKVFCRSPFMKVLMDYGCEVWFIRKVCVIEMIRRTTESKTSQDQPNKPFVDNIDSLVKGWGIESSEDITAKPTTFVSYTGAYTMQDVVQVLSDLDPQEYIWMDIFCVNQFAWTGKGRSDEMRRFRDTFMDDLQNQIQTIGNTALILKQWDNVMVTLGQMWVLWEIFNTAQASVDLKVLLTPEQTKSFIANCLEGSREFVNIQASLATIDANNAVTDDDMDRQFILEKMKKEDGNLAKVNSTVLEVMRNWLLAVGLKHLSETKRQGETVPGSHLLNNLGILAQDQGRLDEAEPLLRDSLKIRRTALGDHHPLTRTSMNNLGTLLKNQGKLAAAEKLLREALEIGQKDLGRGHPHTINSLNNLGNLLREEGKLDEAETLLREAIETSQKALGKRHKETIFSIVHLGNLLYSRGNLEQAQPLFREALETMRDVFGDRHPYTLNSINNMGLLLKAQGGFGEAEALLQEALETKRQVLGNQHPDTLNSINNMGSLVQAQGRLDEAKLLYTEALETMRQVLGNQHQDTLNSINNLGLLLQAQGRLDEAEALLKEAMKTRKEVLGNLHPETLNSINNMGSLLSTRGRFDEGETLLKNSLAAMRQVSGDSHPDTLTSIGKLGNSLFQQGKLDEAEELYSESLEAMRNILGDRHPDTLTTIGNYGLLLLARRRLDEAEPLLKECLESRRIMLGDKHPATLNAMDSLTRLYLTQPGQPHLEQARSFLLHTVCVSKESLGPSHPNTQQRIKVAKQQGFLPMDDGQLTPAD